MEGRLGPEVGAASVTLVTVVLVPAYVLPNG